MEKSREINKVSCATEYDRCESCGRFCPIRGWASWIGWCANPDSPRYRIVIDRDEQPCELFGRIGGPLLLVNDRVPPRRSDEAE